METREVEMPMLCVHCRREIYPRATIPLVEFRKRHGCDLMLVSDNERFWILCPGCKEQNYFTKEYRQGGVSLCLPQQERQRGQLSLRGLDA